MTVDVSTQNEKFRFLQSEKFRFWVGCQEADSNLSAHLEKREAAGLNRRYKARIRRKIT